MKLNKLGIGSVIAVSLLIVVSVGSMVVFQSWFSTFQSNLQVKTELDSTSSNFDLIFVKKVDTGLDLYVKNPSSNPIYLKQLYIDNINCYLLGSNIIIPSNLSHINTNCSGDLGSILNVVLYGSNHVINKKIILR